MQRQGSGSKALRLRQTSVIHMLATVIDMSVISRSFHLHERADMEQSLAHHRDLTLAVRAKDGELARQVMQLHLQMSHHRFMRRRESTNNA